MTEPAASATTPASAGSSSNPAKVAAPKDRTCPYCHVSFTSSSLGRHLDLYIKEKNPKPPDGIHNVEEIRKSRGNITRRQAKSKKRDHDGARRDSQDGHDSNEASPTTATNDLRKNGAHYLRQLFNTPHWTSTGVITDSDANVQFLGSVGKSPLMDAGKEQLSSIPQLDASTRRKWNEERERGRAAELALQEVLDSIKAAKPDREKPEIYDFDFFAQSFPALCLRLLPPPPTMHMPTLIPDPEAWPIEAPEKATFKLLRRKVALHLLKWRDDYYPPNPKKRPRSSGIDGVEPEPEDSPIEPVPLYMHHLDSAFMSWRGMPDGTRQREWHIEVMRAYAWERSEHRNTKTRIGYLETELARARLDNARLTECQMPREWLHTPASQLPIARLAAEKVERELSKDGLDAEKLIAKWRPQVQAVRNSARRNDTNSGGRGGGGANQETDREAGRLVMIGPSRSGGRPSGPGAYDGSVPDNVEIEDDDGYDDDDGGDDEDETMADDRDADDETNNNFDSKSRSRSSTTMFDARPGRRNAPIEPSLRTQLAELSKRSAAAAAAAAAGGN